MAEHTHGPEDCPGLLPPGTILQAALPSWQLTVLPQILDRRESLEDCPLTFKYFLKEVTMYLLCTFQEKNLSPLHYASVKEVRNATCSKNKLAADL